MMWSGLPFSLPPSLPSFTFLLLSSPSVARSTLPRDVPSVQYGKHGGWGGEPEQTSSHPLKPAVLRQKETVTNQPHKYM